MEFTQHLDAKSKIHEYFRFNVAVSGSLVMYHRLINKKP